MNSGTIYVQYLHRKGTLEVRIFPSRSPQIKMGKTRDNKIASFKIKIYVCQAWWTSEWAYEYAIVSHS